MNEPSIAQQLRVSVKLVKPELLSDVPQGYNARQTFNFLRHKATNYDELINSHTSKYGGLTPVEQKALTQGAADVLIEALRIENEDLLQGRANTLFARFAQKISKLLSLGTDIDLEAIYEATKTLKRSQAMYKSWNERYKRQRNLVLAIISQDAPELYEQVKTIYEANSDAALSLLEINKIPPRKISNRKSKKKSYSPGQLSLSLLENEHEESNSG